MKAPVLLLASCWCFSFSLANPHESLRGEQLRLIPTLQNVGLQCSEAIPQIVVRLNLAIRNLSGLEQYDSA
jgi:hypothetical protein